MNNIRLIPRLDIKGENLIKGIRLEGLRVIGDPQEFALKYYLEGADELLYMDIVASLYNRNNLGDIIQKAARNVFVPITVGGGIRKVEDARNLLRAGADKIAINTAAISDPELINRLARRFGSQCVVLSVEAKQAGEGKWECYTDNGRERSGKDVLAWVQEGLERGAGELLITSVDREGTRKGFDIPLVQAIDNLASIPVIVSGGMEAVSDLTEAVKGGADAVAMADILHYGRSDLATIRNLAMRDGVNVREL
ncbi:imidazole glycerol phosphate synthase cyclase subunit [Pseudomonadales bacterium]|nr:imidazole glycerol phosphate synthase cyclase subunit [Pseudomonadales bacterium]